VTRDDLTGGGSYASTMKRALAVALTAIIVAGCSGGDEIATSTTTDTPQPVTTPPTAATTTAPPVTDSPTTPAAPAPTSTAATPPTTAPPAPSSTTPLPVATTAPLPFGIEDGMTGEQVIAIDRDFREGFRLLYAALGDPTNDAAVEAAFTYTTGSDVARTTQLFQILREDNRKLVPSRTVAPSFFIEQGPSPVTGPDLVGLLVCEVAPYALVEIGTGPDGTDTPIRTAPVTQRVEMELRLEDGLWKRSAVRVLGEWEGAVRCPEL
jgi:hypothetical protein